LALTPEVRLELPEVRLELRKDPEHVEKRRPRCRARVDGLISGLQKGSLAFISRTMS
jgi:hypothetical protein